MVNCVEVYKNPVSNEVGIGIKHHQREHTGALVTSLMLAACLQGCAGEARQMPSHVPVMPDIRYYPPDPREVVGAILSNQKEKCSTTPVRFSGPFVQAHKNDVAFSAFTFTYPKTRGAVYENYRQLMIEGLEGLKRFHALERLKGIIMSSSSSFKQWFEDVEDDEYREYLDTLDTIGQLQGSLKQLNLEELKRRHREATQSRLDAEIRELERFIEQIAEEEKSEIGALISQYWPTAKNNQLSRPSQRDKNSVYDLMGATPLTWAAILQDNDAVTTLLDEGADPNKKDARENTPLLVATVIGDARIVQTLIDEGAIANDRVEIPALIAAAALGRTDIVKILLDKGADVNVRDRRGRTPLDLEVVFSEENEGIRELLCRRKLGSY